MTWLAYVWVGLVGAVAAADERAAPGLRAALTFHASFDEKADADFARGDARMYTTVTGRRQDGRPGLLRGDVVVDQTAGKYGGALRFGGRSQAVVYYRAEKNVDYRKRDWSGTVSFWLRLDPEKDLDPVYVDPIQITDKKWNDAALWVDFTKDDTPRRFRYGAFADAKTWNPSGTAWDSIPAKQRPLVAVERPPFSGEAWTHVVMTFSGFNKPGTGGVATLYLNGKSQGDLKDRPQTFTWDPAKAVIQLGINYTGLFDDLAIFNRALTAGEVAALHQRSEVIGALPEKKQAKPDTNDRQDG